MKILISGGTGLVGSRLTEMLEEEGHNVTLLSRCPQSHESIKTIVWDPKNQQLDAEDLKGIDYIFHLAGAGVAGKAWTNSYKKMIASSRIESTQLLYDTIKMLEQKPKGLVSASAVGYYGIRTTDNIYLENDPPDDDFLADTCVKWEKEVNKLSTLGMKVSKIRIGLVLSKKGGALKEIARPAKIGFGAPIGSGAQYMPWIHIDDLCRMFIHCMHQEMEDTFNGVAPEHINNRDFTRKLARVLNKPLWLPKVPSFIMKLLLGERAQLVLQGSRISAEKIQKKGFEFKFESLKEALLDLYS